MAWVFSLCGPNVVPAKAGTQSSAITQIGPPALAG